MYGFISGLLILIHWSVGLIPNTTLFWWLYLLYQALKPESVRSSKFSIFRRLFWVFCVPWNFILSWGRVCSLLEENGSWNFDRDCTDSVNKHREYQHLEITMSSNPLMWKVFSIISSFHNSLQQRSVFFDVQVWNFFRWIYSQMSYFKKFLIVTQYT